MKISATKWKNYDSASTKLKKKNILYLSKILFLLSKVFYFLLTTTTTTIICLFYLSIVFVSSIFILQIIFSIDYDYLIISSHHQHWVYYYCFWFSSISSFSVFDLFHLLLLLLRLLSIISMIFLCLIYKPILYITTLSPTHGRRSAWRTRRRKGMYILFLYINTTGELLFEIMWTKRKKRLVNWCDVCTKSKSVRTSEGISFALFHSSKKRNFKDEKDLCGVI